ncbi:UDP-N-acetylmuramate dehydrogenase [Alkalimarinus coralli]|uniref:UDP-N-acetylmuramate dehydrogenase n=1 Tax=Alkalimarinus coralli TaxID=2935863 RepID=UPI00202B2FC3|nr:UDP-N-acetylmuramate dehydrogenase [Alkalimarinus coralli]
MMLCKRNVDLTTLNTLSVHSTAEYYCEVHDLERLCEVICFARDNGLALHLLGGGSNVILSPYISGVVIRMSIMGREIEHIDSHTADFTVGAGENWHDFVLFTLGQGYSGVENLSLIPGTVGAAPVQNIGAYGVEIKDVLVEVSVVDLEADSLEPITLIGADLDFGYRDSLFKRLPGRFIIVSVKVRLNKNGQLKTSYGDIKNRLPKAAITAKDVSNAVIEARKSKLPDVQSTPNAGSFFKNPVVEKAKLDLLLETYPDTVFYDIGSGLYKLAAGWLIQEAGWKGYREERVGVHSMQALVLINHNSGSSTDILNLAERINKSVKSKFGISLEIEPVLL